MARQEADRDDLFSEATALTTRALWKRFPSRGFQSSQLRHGQPEFEVNSSRLDAFDEVLIGTRENTWLSVYWDQSWMVQFNEVDRIRRAFVEPDLYRSQGGTMSRLRRRRTPHETALLRHDLNAQELTEFLKGLSQRLNETIELIESCRSGEREGFQLVSIVAPENSVLSAQLQTLLNRLHQICQRGLEIAEPPPRPPLISALRLLQADLKEDTPGDRLAPME